MDQESIVLELDPRSVYAAIVQANKDVESWGTINALLQRLILLLLASCIQQVGGKNSRLRP
jgi:hypothetical protein